MSYSQWNQIPNSFNCTNAKNHFVLRADAAAVVVEEVDGVVGEVVSVVIEVVVDEVKEDQGES